MVDQADTWRRVAATPAALPAVQPALDTYASAGHLSVSWTPRPPALLLGEVPGVSRRGARHPADRLRLGVAEFPGTGDALGIDVEGHGRDEELLADVDLSRTVGWFTTKYPVA